MRVLNKKGTGLLALTVVATAILLGVWLIFARLNHTWPFLARTPLPSDTYRISYDPPTVDQVTDSSVAKDRVAESQTKSSSRNQASTVDTLPVTITSIQPGEIVYVRANIGQYVPSGVCTLAMSGPSNKTYSATADIQPLASSSTCKGFNIPMGTLSPGVWKFTIGVYVDSKSGFATAEREL